MRFFNLMDKLYENPERIDYRGLLVRLKAKFHPCDQYVTNTVTKNVTKMGIKSFISVYQNNTNFIKYKEIYS